MKGNHVNQILALHVHVFQLKETNYSGIDAFKAILILVGSNHDRLLAMYKQLFKIITLTVLYMYACTL